MADVTTTPTTPVKPGYKTTEFWLALFAQLLGLLVLIGKLTPEQQSALMAAAEKLAAAIVMGASAFGYTLSRGIAKKNAAEATGSKTEG